MRPRHSPLFRTFAALSLAGSLGACATLTESTEQTLYVQTVLDNVEVFGAGCVLSNRAGRWFVTAPGRVTVQKSYGDLTVDCKKEGGVGAVDQVASKNTTLFGNIATAGLGYYVDKHTGAGFDYPATLTIMLHKAADPQAGQLPLAAGNPVY